jgi:hypothetical protein
VATDANQPGGPFDGLRPVEDADDRYLRVFRDVIERLFERPAREVLQQINQELASDPKTRDMRLELQLRDDDDNDDDGRPRT